MGKLNAPRPHICLSCSVRRTLQLHLLQFDQGDFFLQPAPSSASLIESQCHTVETPSAATPVHRVSPRVSRLPQSCPHTISGQLGSLPLSALAGQELQAVQKVLSVSSRWAEQKVTGEQLPPSQSLGQRPKKHMSPTQKMAPHYGGKMSHL